MEKTYFCLFTLRRYIDFQEGAVIFFSLKGGGGAGQICLRNTDFVVINFHYANELFLFIM